MFDNDKLQSILQEIARRELGISESLYNSNTATISLTSLRYALQAAFYYGKTVGEHERDQETPNQRF